MKITRRHLIAGIGLGGVGTALALGYNSTEQLGVTKLPIISNKVPAEFHNYRIGFISDIHYGESFSQSFLETILSTLAKLEVDIVALGGDYLWIPFSIRSRCVRIVRNSSFSSQSYRTLMPSIMNELATAIKDWLRPPDGVLAIAGNHDNHHNGRRVLGILENYEFAVLINKTLEIRRGKKQLQFIGIDDYLTGLPRMPRIDTSKNSFSILLCHNPDYIIEWLEANNELPAHLSLCGHTHGGQIRAPVIQYPLLCNVSDSRFIQGLTEINGRFSFTSRGTGNVEIPLRIACPAEVSLITLQNPELL